jgi:hypothetical protein
VDLSARLARLVVRRPIAVLLAALALSLALLPLVLRLRLDTDVVKLVPKGDPAAQAFARFARTFVAEQVLIALVESEDPGKLEPFADQYADELAKLPNTAEVRHRLRAESAGFMREHLTMLLLPDEIAALAPRVTPEALKAQAKRLRGLLSAPGGSAMAPLLTADPLELVGIVGTRLKSGLPVDTSSGYFKSADGRALVIYVRPKTGSYDVEADRALMEAATRAAQALGAHVTEGDFGKPGITVSFTGACAYTLYYRDWLHRDASLSTPVSAIAVLLLFALFFRSLRILPLVALPLATGLLWTGAAAWLLYRNVNAVSLTFGTVLLSIGIDFPIQIYNRLREELQARAPLDALEVTLRELAAPSLTATLGPCVVFFSCALSDYRGLADLGILAGVGLILNLIAMLTVFPALLAVLPPVLWAKKEQREPAAGRALGALGRAAGRRPRTILIVATLIAVASVPLLARVRFDRRLISVHPEEMPPVKTEAEMSRRFGEREKMAVALVEDKDHERALARGDAWMMEAERLRRAGRLRGYQSVSSLFPSKASQAERRAAWEKLGADRIARDLRAALDDAGFDVAPFERFLSQLTAPAPISLEEAQKHDLDFLVRNHVHDEPEGTRRVATFFFPQAGAESPLEPLAAFARGEAGGVLTGVPILEQSLRAIVVADTWRVTLVSAAGVILLLLLHYRRWRPFVATLAPLVFAWIVFGATLAALDLPLNLFNLLSVPLVIGYGIDDLVFLVHRHGERPERGPEGALRSTGRGVLVTTLATIAGFAGLAVARFDGLKLFGTSGALAVAVCLVGALAVLPALLALLRPRDD